MTDPVNDHAHLPDERIDEIFEQIVDRASSDPADVQAQGARKVLDLIERVRSSEQKETAIPRDTVNVGTKTSRTFDDKLELPELIGRFRIERVLGSGGFGMVLLAHDPDLQRAVALKIPRPQAFASPELTARFIREGRAAASLSHPNIVPVFESGQIGAVCYMAAQFVPGVTLEQFRTDHPDQLTPRVSAAVVARLAEAMGHAHQRGVLHRDLKPANILVESSEEAEEPLEERVRITDFGLARIDFDQLHTQTGAMVGTPAYMSPEQSGSSNEIGPGSDIWGLGAILYQLLTGHAPFESDDLISTVESIRKHDPKPPVAFNRQIDSDLSAICMKCLEKEPARRYENAFALKDDLQACLDNRPVTARPPTSIERLIRWSRRNPAIATSMTVSFLFLLLALAGSLFGMIRSNQALQREKSALKTETDALQKERAATDTAEQRYRDLKIAIDTYYTSVAEDSALKDMPGSGELRKELLQLSLSYYEQYVTQQQDDPQLPAELAETESRIADILNEMGSHDLALQHAEDGLELCEGLPEEIENDYLVSIRSDLLAQKSAALVGLGKLIESMEPIETAIADRDSLDVTFQEYSSLLSLCLLRKDKAKLLWKMGRLDEAKQENELLLPVCELARTLPNADTSRISRIQLEIQGELATVAKSSGDLDRALQIQKEMLDEIQPLLIGNPNDWKLIEMYLVTGLNRCGSLLAKGEFQAALDLLDQADPYSQRMSMLFPLVERYGRMQLGIIMRYQVAWNNLKDVDKVAEYGQRAVSVARSMVAINPRSATARVGLLNCLTNSTAVRLFEDVDRGPLDTDTADALELARELDEEDTYNQILLAQALRNRAQLELESRDYSQSLVLSEESLGIVDALMAKLPNDRRVKDNLHSAITAVALAQRELGQFGASIESWRRSIETAENAYIKRIPAWRIRIACAMMKMGDMEDSREIVDAIETDLLKDKGKILLAAWHMLMSRQPEEDSREHKDISIQLVREVMNAGYFESQRALASFEYESDLMELASVPEIEALINEARAALEK